MADVQPAGPEPAVAAPAASHRVAAFLREAILSGEIAPGERIRQEDVAERIGGSRLPVREAVRMLEAEGLIEYETNKGARVPVLGMREVDLIYQMRERLEPLALIESIPRLTDAHFDELGDIQAQIEQGVDVASFLQLDRRFHLLTYSLCEFDALTSMVIRLWNATQHHRRMFMALIGSGQRWVVNAEHNLLLESLRRRDAVDAERYLQGHIRRTRIELSRHPEVFDRT
ncbi:MAG: GntR family transcriptional regulator [Pseudonocardiales bacterium]|nr:GntR family transcriptional regulator [Pseudonocardiales bacterium]